MASRRRCSEFVWFAFFCAVVRGTRVDAGREEVDEDGLAFDLLELVFVSDFLRFRDALDDDADLLFLAGCAFEPGHGPNGDVSREA